MHSTRQTVRCLAALLGTLLIAGFVTTAHAEEQGATAAVSLLEGVSAYRAGQPLRALAVFAQVAHDKPQSAMPALWAGVAATAAGKTQEAEGYFREGLRRPHSAIQERIAQAWLRRLRALWEGPWGPDAPNGIAALARASNPRLSMEQAYWMGDHVVAAARAQGLDPWLLASVVYIESRFNPTARSWAGATGLGQLMPSSARDAGVNPKDPWQNLIGTAALLRWHYLEFRDWNLALAAYNAGGGAVRRYGGIPPYAETQWYVGAVRRLYQRIRPNG